MNKTYYRILYCVYDANGNMVSDANRGVSEVRYNSLNLPSRIVFNNVRRIENRYRADGVKLSSEMIMGKIPEDEVTIKSLVPGLITETMAGGDDVVVTPGGAKPIPDKVIDTKTYIGNYEFSGDSLLRLNTPYGYFHQGHYYVNAYDYQGNLVASGGNYACGVAQDNSYYPYGLNIYGLGNNKFTPYLFGGKEFEERQGLNLYDFHARTYVPDIARFMQPDPKADDYNWLSPYAYCGGDPINKVDLTGMDIYEFNSVGALANIIKEPRYDLVRIKTSSGRIQERVFERGTIYGIKKVKFEGAPQSYYFKVKGVENSDNIYMMLATNTSAEWSLVRSKDKETGSIENYIGTSQDSYQERTGAYVMRKVMNHEENILERDIHSHPDNSMPSGFPEDKKPGVPENGDIPLARIIQELYPYFDDFELLRVKSLRIERYNKDSRKNDFINYLQEIYIN